MTKPTSRARAQTPPGTRKRVHAELRPALIKARLKMLSPHDIRRIAVEAKRDPRAVKNALAGRGKPLTLLAVAEAMKRLGMKWPAACSSAGGET